MLDLGKLTNPVWRSADNLRDPGVLPTQDGYWLFYSRFSGRDWGNPQNWSIARVFTRDFATFEGDCDLSPRGFASPGDPVLWHGRYILPYQSYPAHPPRLCYAESADGRSWSQPQWFLPEVNTLSWNMRKRAIDPSFVVNGDEMHCFFIGSCDTEDPNQHANLLGQAVTRDPELKEWEILTPSAPLIGRSAEAWDGVENVAVFRTGSLWTMIYSEGLADQHLAYAQSCDLRKWDRRGRIDLPKQNWMMRKYGAPCIFRDGQRWVMILMGTDQADRTTFGLLTSEDGLRWHPLPEGRKGR